jgi:hypothetical protein
VPYKAALAEWGFLLFVHLLVQLEEFRRQKQQQKAGSTGENLLGLPTKPAINPSIRS